MNNIPDMKKFVNDGMEVLLDFWSWSQSSGANGALEERLDGILTECYRFLEPYPSQDSEVAFHYGRLAGFAECLKMTMDYTLKVRMFKESMEVETIMILVELYRASKFTLHSDLRQHLRLTDERVYAAINPAIRYKLVDNVPNGFEDRYMLTKTGERYVQGLLNPVRENSE